MEETDTPATDNVIITRKARTMSIRYLASQLRPTTLAAMITDLLDMPVANAETIEALLEQLEHSVGDEMAIEFLVDAGALPEQLEMARR
jgi:hypothetical protein